MARIKNRFRILLAQKESRDGRRYTYDDIYQATGIGPGTLSSYAKGSVTRFDQETLIKLCDFLECDLAELIEYPPDQSQQNSSPLRMTAVGVG